MYVATDKKCIRFGKSVWSLKTLNSASMDNSIFLSAIWLPHGQLRVTAKWAASLTQC